MNRWHKFDDILILKVLNRVLKRDDNDDELLLYKLNDKVYIDYGDLQNSELENIIAFKFSYSGTELAEYCVSMSGIDSLLPENTLEVIYEKALARYNKKERTEHIIVEQIFQMVSWHDFDSYTNEGDGEEQLIPVNEINLKILYENSTRVERWKDLYNYKKHLEKIDCLSSKEDLRIFNDLENIEMCMTEEEQETIENLRKN